MASLPEPGAFFEPGGPLAGVHPGYERRPPQIEMARAVARVLREGGRLVVEAGTGTGKTLAYLVPALASGHRVMVSTGTRALQDQLIQRDLPFLGDLLDRDFRAACLKGRSNYLCIHHLQEAERTPDLFEGEAGRIAHIAAWGRRTRTGDVAELEDLPEGLALWDQLNARSETCLGRECEHYDDCWLLEARERARGADVVVVNHHLLLADLAVRSGFGELLPDYGVLIVDEAHRLEETATHCFGRTVSNRRVLDLAGDALRLEARPELDLPGTGGAARTLRTAGEEFFRLLPRGAGRHLLDREKLGRHEETVDGLRRALSGLASGARSEARGVEEVAALTRRAEEVAQDLAQALEESPDRVTWVSVRGRFRALVCSPIDVSSLLAEHLFAPLHAAVLTSATLAIEESTRWIRLRLGIPEAEELVLPSPFDTESQSLLYVPEDLPPPASPEFLEAAADRMRRLVLASRGRAFLLFTSYANLRGAAELLRGRLGDYPLMVQGEAPKHTLLERFREAGDAVLLATASFWEGVDVPGEALSLVAVDKLPFASPGDPVVAARIRALREEGRSPFMEYQVPDAVISLKQGLGRLLRSRADRGVLAVLDVRLRTKGYGRSFLRSLPACPRTGDLDRVESFFA